MAYTDKQLLALEKWNLEERMTSKDHSSARSMLDLIRAERKRRML